jgi:hypothetical protein
MHAGVSVKWFLKLPGPSENVIAQQFYIRFSNIIFYETPSSGSQVLSCSQMAECTD